MMKLKQEVVSSIYFTDKYSLLTELYLLKPWQSCMYLQAEQYVQMQVTFKAVVQLKHNYVINQHEHLE